MPEFSLQFEAIEGKEKLRSSMKQQANREKDVSKRKGVSVKDVSNSTKREAKKMLQDWRGRFRQCTSYSLIQVIIGFNNFIIN